MTDAVDLLASGGDALEMARLILPSAATRPQHQPIDVFYAIAGEAELPELEEAQGVEAMMARILGAPTLEEAMTGTGAESAEKVLGRRLTIDRPRWYPTEYAGAPRCFAVVEAVDAETDTVTALVIGSQVPLTIIWRAWVEGLLPLRCVLTRAEKATKAGFYPFNLGSW